MYNMEKAPHVQHGEGFACVTVVFHGHVGHARGCIPHLGRVVSKTAQDEEGTLAHSSFADQVVGDLESQAY